MAALHFLGSPAHYAQVKLPRIVPIESEAYGTTVHFTRDPVLASNGALSPSQSFPLRGSSETVFTSGWTQ